MVHNIWAGHATGQLGSLLVEALADSNYQLQHFFLRCVHCLHLAAYCAAAAASQEPEQYCSADTALSLAKAAYQRAAALTAFGTHVVGLAATCALASEPPKRGQHRAYVAAHSGSGSRLLAVVLAKGARSRWQEEQLVGQALLQVGGWVCRGALLQ